MGEAKRKGSRRQRRKEAIERDEAAREIIAFVQQWFPIDRKEIERKRASRRTVNPLMPIYMRALSAWAGEDLHLRRHAPMEFQLHPGLDEHRFNKDETGRSRRVRDATE